MITGNRCSCNEQSECGYKQAVDTLQELVEKVVPKKPILKAMDGFSPEVARHLVCPSCKKPIVNVWSRAEYKPRYCHYCGQKLDWSKKE